MFEMDNHDYLVDNEDSKSSVNHDHAVQPAKVCSYQQGETTENCSFPRIATCGDSSVAFKERLIYKAL